MIRSRSRRSMHDIGQRRGCLIEKALDIHFAARLNFSYNPKSFYCRAVLLAYFRRIT
jgi:hypothetical protein